MSISTKCPECGKMLKVPEKLAGKTLKCPACKCPLGPVELPTQGGSDVADDPTIIGQTADPVSLPAGAGFDFLAPAHGPGEIGWLGGYRVVKVLGEGGMGVVFQAEDIKLQRIVALKAMRPAVAASADSGSRFLREARAAAAIEHDHIVAIYQVGEDGGVPYLAMQFLRGEPLDDRLRRQRILPIPDVLRISREIAEGLLAAHSRGLIHRDIKPANIWLEEGRDRVKIVDFGLARSSRKEDAQLTQQGAIVGTPAFMAPEQGRGGTVDARSDLFSLGCVMYCMATGQAPFHGVDIISTLMSVATDQPKDPRQLNPAIPRELSDLILRLLEKDPAKRPSSARAVSEAIEAIENKRPIAKTGGGWKWAIVAGLLLTVCAAGVVIGLKFLHKPDGGTTGKLPPVQGNPALPLAPAELILDTDHRAVRMVVKQDGKEVKMLNLADGTSASLDPGDYDLELSNAPPGLLLSASKVTLSPGTRQTIRLLREPLSDQALVHRPLPLPGVRSWTIETVAPRGPVLSVAYHPKGRWLAAAGHDGVIRLWDPGTSRLVRALVGHQCAIMALAWSPDGRILASAGAGRVPTVNRMMPPAKGAVFPPDRPDPTVRLWEAESGKLLHVLAGHEDTIRALAWSPDGKTLASAGHDHTIRYWNPVDGKLKKTIAGHKHWFHAMAWSPNGKLLATDFFKDIEIRDATSGKVLRTLNGHESWILSLAWAPKGGRLASGSQDGTVRLWRPNATVPERTMTDPGAAVRLVAWSPGGTRVAGVPDEGKAVCIWEVPSGRRWASWFAGENTCMDWHPTGDSVVLGTWNGAVKVWRSGPVRLEHTLAPGRGRACIHPVAFAPDGKTVVIAEGYRLQAWDLTSVKPPRLFPIGPRWIMAVAWSADGKTLATADNRDNVVRLWDFAAGKVRAGPMQGHTDVIHRLAFSHDGEYVASASRDNTVILWDARTGRLHRFLRGHTGDVLDVAFRPTGGTVATVSQDSTVRLWNVETGRETHQGQHDGVAQRLAWSSDGRLATCGNDGMVRLWQGDDCKPLKTFGGKRGNVNRVAWLPEGHTIASLDALRRLRVWDASSGKLALGFPAVSRMGTFSSDGRLLAAMLGSRFGSAVRFFDSATGLPGGTIVLQGIRPFIISAGGHYQGPEGIEDEIVYVVQTDKGQETLRPAEFAKRFSWKNDPSQALLAPPKP
jgi:WD40 repeat protein